MATNLTTLYLFKTHADISGTDDDTLIGWLIDQVSEAIAKWCDRTFEATSYLSWLDGSGTRYLTLPQFPVTNLYGVATETVVALKLTQTSGVFASISVRDGSLYLDSIDSSATESHDTVTLSGRTIATLATAAEAVTGWTAETTSGYTTRPAILVRGMAAQNALSPYKADVEVADDWDDVRICADSNQQIEALSGVFPCGAENVLVWYKAGYTLPVDNDGHTSLTTEGNVPDDLTFCANQILKTVFETMQEKVGGMQSERTQTYSYSLREGAKAVIAEQIEAHASVLTPHKSMRMG